MPLADHSTSGLLTFSSLPRFGSTPAGKAAGAGRQGGTEHPGESVDQYALRIDSLFTRLLAESQRTALPKKPSERFAWEHLKIAVFENGLLPPIRFEQVREEPAHTFASVRNRTRKHASNILHGMNAIKVSSVESTPTTPLKNQLETCLDDVQAAIVSLVEAFKHHKSGRSKTQRRATHGGEGNKVPRRDKTSSKGK